MEEDIKRLKNEICLNGINVNYQTVVNLVQKQNELVNLRNEKIEGVMLRSKCRYMDLGEKPTNYFFSLETRNYTSKVINKLIDEDIEYTTSKFREFMSPAIIVYDSKNARKMPKLK